ncbi:RNA-splicing factor [Ascosphaera aggregata]|nr:RNA-splicing factor [Ascosphaera aggregata]
MSANVGLPTPRGSGTSGYVQRNLSYLKPRDPRPSPYVGPEEGFKQRQPDKQILEHDRRRMVEVKVLEERDRLEEENERIQEAKAAGKDAGQPELTEDEIEERLDALRKKLTKELEDELAGKTQRPERRGWGGPLRREDNRLKERRNFKSYQVHEQAEAKIEESERFRRAVNIPGEGDRWNDGSVGDRRSNDAHSRGDARGDNRDEGRRYHKGDRYRRDRDREPRRRRSYSRSRSRSPPPYRDLDKPLSPDYRD